MAVAPSTASGEFSVAWKGCARRNRDLLRRWRRWWRRWSCRSRRRSRGWRCLRDLSWSVRRVVLILGYFVTTLYCRGRFGLLRRRGLGLDRRGWRRGNLQIVYHLLHARFTGRIARGCVTLSVVVHLAGEGHAPLVCLDDELFALETGIGVQFVLNITGNLGVRRSLGAADGHQDGERHYCGKVKRKPVLHKITPLDVSPV